MTESPRNFQESLPVPCQISMWYLPLHWGEMRFTKSTLGIGSNFFFWSTLKHTPFCEISHTQKCKWRPSWKWKFLNRSLNQPSFTQIVTRVQHPWNSSLMSDVMRMVTIGLWVIPENICFNNCVFILMCFMKKHKGYNLLKNLGA